MLLFVLYLMFLFSRNVTNIPAVLQALSTCQWFCLLTVCCQLFTHQLIVFGVVRPTQSIFFSSRASSLVSRVSSRGFAARPSRTHARPSLNLKKKRDCSQSRPNSSHRILGVCLWESSHILNVRYRLYTIFV